MAMTGAVPGAMPETGEHNVHPAYRADIDGLRAVAILLVVIFHAFPAAVSGGFVGVDVFFVISGYLISTIIFRSLERGDFRFGEFYAHRIRRLFPALLAMLTGCFIAGWFELWPDEYLQLGKHMAGGIGFVTNWLLWGEAGYFDTASELKPLLHLWSLGIEEQYYLVYPVVVWAIWRGRGSGALGGWLAGLALLSFGLGVMRLAADPVAAFFLPQYRMWELLAGGLLALGGHRQQVALAVLQTRYAGVLGGLGLALVVGAALGFDGEFAFPGAWALVPVFGALLMLAAGPQGGVNRKILAHPLMRFIGVISYPLYLWHWPLLAFARVAGASEADVGARVLAVATSFLLAWGTYRWIERPVRFGGGSVRLWVVGLVVGALLLGGVGWMTYEREGFRFRQRSFGERPEVSGTRTWEKASPGCRARVGPPAMDFCREPETGDPRVVLVGDSHAGSLYPGLASALDQRGVGLLFLGNGGCPPLFDTDFARGGDAGAKGCMAVTNHALEVALAAPTAEVVVLSLRGPRNMHGTGFGPVEASMRRKDIRWLGGVAGASNEATFSGALEATVRRVVNAGKRLVIVADWPELGFDPRVCVRARPFQLGVRRAEECVVSLAAAEARNAPYRALLAELASRFPAVTVFDPWPGLCGAGVCRALEGGDLLYADNNHLSLVGSRELGRALAATLLQH
ncbi:MAG: acyltransferase [Zoogloeaceae bacterium]|nr:acyltransferase [Zoogloeaceae bacterium]